MIYVENTIFVSVISIPFQIKKFLDADSSGEQTIPVFIENFHPTIKIILRNSLIKICWKFSSFYRLYIIFDHKTTERLFQLLNINFCMQRKCFNSGSITFNEFIYFWKYMHQFILIRFCNKPDVFIEELCIKPFILLRLHHPSSVYCQVVFFRCSCDY